MGCHNRDTIRGVYLVEQVGLFHFVFREDGAGNQDRIAGVGSTHNRQAGYGADHVSDWSCPGGGGPACEQRKREGKTS